MFSSLRGGKGRRLAEEIIADPKRVSNLLRRAKEASPGANQSPPQETKNHILSIILSNPGITNKQIKELLEEQYGKLLGIVGIRQLSTSLQKEKFIRAETQGSVKKFFPNKPPESS